MFLPQIAFLKSLDTDRIVHSIKTALACLLGFIIIKLIHLPVDQWLIITIIVVMCAQINVGGVIAKSNMRFLGTLTGSLLAALTLSLFGNNPIAIICMIMLSAILFSYIATSDSGYSDSGTLGAVTVIIILLGPNPTIFTAAHRFFEISVGIVIAAVVSQFILPIHARNHLRRMQAKTLIQMRAYYFATLMTEQNENVIKEYQELDEAIVKTLSSQRSLAQQASREPLGTTFDPTHFNKLLRCEKEIFRSIVCMHYACDMLPDGRNSFPDLPAIKNFHQAIHQSFEKIAPRIEQQDFSKTPIVIPSLQPMKDAISALSKTVSNDDLVYINGFLFCAELLVMQLTELVVLCRLGSKEG